MTTSYYMYNVTDMLVEWMRYMDILNYLQGYVLTRKLVRFDPTNGYVLTILLKYVLTWVRFDPNPYGGQWVLGNI